jgi:hypothetical protein
LPTGSLGQLKEIRGISDQAFEITGIHSDEILVAKGHFRMAFDITVGKGEDATAELQLARLLVSRL